MILTSVVPIVGVAVAFYGVVYPAPYAFGHYAAPAGQAPDVPPRRHADGWVCVLLFSLTASVKSGADVTMLESDEELTPTRAAGRLQLSRTDFYKLLDRDEIASRRGGRDRRIRTADLREFEPVRPVRQRDRRALAERFARTADTRAGAIAELVEDTNAWSDEDAGMLGARLLDR